jgi:aldose sugar dehydrogenase
MGDRMRSLLFSLITMVLGWPALAQSYQVQTLARGLDDPWAIEFIPGTADMLITQRGGQVLLWDAASGRTVPVSGGPRVTTQGQGGLLDIAMAPDFATTGHVYMTWAGRVQGQGSTTHLGRARLDRAGGRLTDLEVLHVVSPARESGAHFGSRIVFADGYVFVGFGDRGDKNFGPDHLSQDLSTENGSVIRLTMDGHIPSSNPFVGQAGAAGAIWSYGHRNIQAMARHPRTGALWLAEHGEAGGDEVNIVQRGGNFGWPLAAYGITYRGGQRFAPPHQPGDGFVAPVYHWPPGRDAHFPPSGMVFYDGAAFPDWRGHLLIGNLFHRYIGLFRERNGQLQPVARLLDGAGMRIRDLAVGPDGFVYVLSDGGNGTLMRLVPAL